MENENGSDEIRISGGPKLLLYSIALAAAMGVNIALSSVFGETLGGLPSFSMEGELALLDYLMIVPYILAGIMLAVLYSLLHEKSGEIMGKIPPVGREAASGVCIGIAAMFLPVILFSGEEELLLLITDFSMYTVVLWLGIAVLKIVLTCICIQGGLKGGHFFPLIFVGTSFGFGVSYLIFQGGGHEVFGAAVVTAALLGCSLKKPLAVTVLLALCFPPRICVWIFAAAAVGGKIFSHIPLFRKKDIKEK